MRRSSQAHIALRILQTPRIPVTNCPRNMECGWQLPELLQPKQWEPDLDAAVRGVSGIMFDVWGPLPTKAGQ